MLKLFTVPTKVRKGKRELELYFNHQHKTRLGQSPLNTDAMMNGFDGDGATTALMPVVPTVKMFLLFNVPTKVEL